MDWLADAVAADAAAAVWAATLQPVALPECEVSRAVPVTSSQDRAAGN